MRVCDTQIQFNAVQRKQGLPCGIEENKVNRQTKHTNIKRRSKITTESFAILPSEGKRIITKQPPPSCFCCVAVPVEHHSPEKTGSPCTLPALSNIPSSLLHFSVCKPGKKKKKKGEKNHSPT